MRIALTGIVLATILGPPVVADEVRILSSRGGEVGQFIDMFDRQRKSRDRVVIDGPCLSACTLVLSAVPKDRICVTRRAILGFHAARLIDPRGANWLAFIEFAGKAAEIARLKDEQPPPSDIPHGHDRVIS